MKSKIDGKVKKDDVVNGHYLAFDASNVELEDAEIINIIDHSKSPSGWMGYTVQLKESGVKYLVNITEAYNNFKDMFKEKDGVLTPLFTRVGFGPNKEVILA